jgi:predicted aspartyl protease
VNGRAATFMVDTGAESSFLQADRAQVFGLRATGTEARTGRRSFPLGTADNLRLGEFPLGPTTFSLYRAAQLGGPVPGQRGRAADGLIGRDLLRRYKAVINCRSRQLFLKADAGARLDLASITRTQGFTAIRIEETGRGLTVPCTIAGRAGRLVLDTGAFLTGFDDDAARLLGLSGQPSAATARSFEGRVRPLQLVQVDDFKIGGVAVPPQKFVVTDLFTRKPLRTYTGMGRIEFYSPRSGARGDRIYGLLGSELLDLHQAIIDLDSMTLFMK